MSQYPPPPPPAQQPPPPYCPPPPQQQAAPPPPQPPPWYPYLPPYFGYQKPVSGWMIALWVILGILGLLLLIPIFKYGLYIFGGSCSAVIGVAVIVLATWKLVDLLILGFRKLFPPPPPQPLYPYPGYPYPPQG